MKLKQWDYLSALTILDIDWQTTPHPRSHTESDESVIRLDDTQHVLLNTSSDSDSCISERRENWANLIIFCCQQHPSKTKWTGPEKSN